MHMKAGCTTRSKRYAQYSVNRKTVLILLGAKWLSLNGDRHRAIESHGCTNPNLPKTYLPTYQPTYLRDNVNA